MKKKSVHRLVTAVVGISLATSTTAVTTALQPANAEAARAGHSDAKAAGPALRPTRFALSGSGFGSRVVGGEVPAGSSTTAAAGIGCTNQVGRRGSNDEAKVVVPGLGVLRGVSTTVRTTQRDGVVASTTTQRIESLTLAASGLGSLRLEALRTRARALHGEQGFRAVTRTELGRLVLRPVAGDPQVLPLPTADQPVVVPGLARLSVAPQRRYTTTSGASALARGLEVEVIPSGTVATVGQAWARIDGGVFDAIFRGSASGVHARGLEGAATKGRTPLSGLPCQGTGGEVRSKSIAALQLDDAIELGALNSSVVADQDRSGTRGRTRGSVASLVLGDDQLVIRGIVGQAVYRDGRFGAPRSGVASVTVDGERRTFPRSGVLRIPGVAVLEERLVRRQPDGIAVIGLRVTLLDGSAATIDLGTASIGTRPSGL